MNEEGTRRLHLPVSLIGKQYFKTASIGVAVLVLITLIFLNGKCAAAQENDINDTISRISFSHDGKKVLFDRCREKKCRIQVYNLETGGVSAYESPLDERWTMARYSDDGKNIVFSIIPIDRNGFPDLGNMQIAVMNPDGMNVRKITTGSGVKIHPTFSHSGKKVLYAKGSFIGEKGEDSAAQFDAWEVNLETGQEKRLTYFKFFEMSHLTYLPDDMRFICNADWPYSFPGVREGDWREVQKRNEEWKRKYMSNTIHVLHEGQARLDVPFVMADTAVFNQASENPLLSRDGKRLFFKGSGGKYYIYSPSGRHKLVGGGGAVNSAAISPDGELLGLITTYTGIHIYRIRDGSLQERISVPTAQHDDFKYDRLSKFKLLPEQPLRIINRLYKRVLPNPITGEMYEQNIRTKLHGSLTRVPRWGK
jgi:hypothetical protein